MTSSVVKKRQLKAYAAKRNYGVQVTWIEIEKIYLVLIRTSIPCKITNLYFPIIFSTFRTYGTLPPYLLYNLILWIHS